MRLLLGLSLTFSALGAYAAPDRVAYELQERCGKRATEVIKADGPAIQTTKDQTTISSFTAHYNATMNRCFVLSTSSGVIKSAKDKEPSAFNMETLFDVNSNKEYGTWFQGEQPRPMCTFRGKRCSSKDEWDALVKQFMEESN